MASRMTKKHVKNTNADKARMKRFLFLWAPIICLVLVGVYASALDPPRPTGRLINGSVTEIKKSSQQRSSVLYKIKLESGEEIEIPVPGKQKPDGSQVVIEEFSTALLKKKTYQIRDTIK